MLRFCGEMFRIITGSVWKKSEHMAFRFCFLIKMFTTQQYNKRIFLNPKPAFGKAGKFASGALCVETKQLLELKSFSSFCASKFMKTYIVNGEKAILLFSFVKTNQLIALLY